MRKLLLLLLLLLCLPLLVWAEAELTVIPGEMGFEYRIETQDEWVMLSWKGQNEGGRKTLYSADGVFEGTVELPYSAMGGKCTITVEDLNPEKIAEKVVEIPQHAGYCAPVGKTNASVTALKLTPTPEGFRYSFRAPGSDYVMLSYRSKQENAYFPVYPTEDGLYEGEVKAELTYARALITVQVCNARGNIKREGTVRKSYEAPAAPETQSGRLSGVIVCVDPGHYENYKAVREPRGPGLDGTVSGTSGMAQGRYTLRREDIVVLETGIILRDMLIREGATVIMTREDQTTEISNMKRSEMANEAGAHITLRLHCNLMENARMTGIQVYGPRNSEYARAVAEPQEYRELGQLLLDQMKLAVGFDLTPKTGNVALNDAYVGNNWAKMVCFLVEMGYMSNKGEDIKLATPEYQTMLSQGMVEGIYQIALWRGWVKE